jgi:hypothetical protein
MDASMAEVTAGGSSIVAELVQRLKQNTNIVVLVFESFRLCSKFGEKMRGPQKYYSSLTF